MAGSTEEIHVRGLDELKAKLRRAGDGIPRDFTKELQTALQPAGEAAHGLAVSEISHMHDRPWSKFRVVAKSKGAYMAPSQRGTSSKQSRAQRRGRYSKMSGSRLASTGRPNLAPLLLTRAMEPAFEATKPLLIARMNVVFAKYLD